MAVEAREKLSFAVIDAIAHKHNLEPGASIPVLQEIQDAYGYVPPVAIERIAQNINVPVSELFGLSRWGKTCSRFVMGLPVT
jgi:NADH:ubiquinone oxidoreductase subunit E